MGQPLLFVIRVAHNQVSVCWSEHECEQLRLVFSHPRTLLGQYQVLLHGLKPVLQQVKPSMNTGVGGTKPRRYCGCCHRNWVVSPKWR